MFCKNKLSTLQRTFGVIVSLGLILTAVLTIWVREYVRNTAIPGPGSYLLALLPAIPFLAILFVTIRYLSREQDEFIRTLVLHSLLWGLAITVAASAIWGFLSDSRLVTPLPEMFYIDVFFVASIFALAIQRRKYQ